MWVYLGICRSLNFPFQTRLVHYIDSAHVGIIFKHELPGPFGACTGTSNSSLISSSLTKGFESVISPWQNTKRRSKMKALLHIGDGKPPTFYRNPYNGYINTYYWVDEFIPYYGNNGSLDPGL